jgi:hypothetical protein
MFDISPMLRQSFSTVRNSYIDGNIKSYDDDELKEIIAFQKAKLYGDPKPDEERKAKGLIRECEDELRKRK